MYANPAVQISQANDWAAIFANGYIDVYAGAQPSDATKPATGTKIGYITHNGDPVVPGNVTNGLTFDAAYESADGLWVVLPFAAACVPTLFCSLAAGQSANIAWMRLYPNAGDDGLEDTDNTRPRVDIPAGTLLDAAIGGLTSGTGSLKVYGQTKSALNVKEFLWPLFSGQQYTG